MASDYVSRRLAEITEMSVDLPKAESIPVLQSPEVTLWLAVIERAIVDLTDPTIHIPAEFRRDLDWFFWERPQAFNLAYICENYLDSDDILPSIRKRLRQIMEGKAAATPKCRLRLAR